MTLVAELRLASETLPLLDVVTALPSEQIHLLSSTLLGHGKAVFTLEIDEESQERFEAEVRRDHRVEASTLISRTANGLLYQVRLSGLSTIFDPCGPEIFASTPLRTLITPEGWFEKKAFANFEMFELLQERCIESDVGLAVLSISSTDAEADIDADDSPLSVLTQRQRQALEIAFARGYYQSPSQLSLAELGEELNISAASASGLLGRAERRLIGHVLDQGAYTPLTG